MCVCVCVCCVCLSRHKCDLFSFSVFPSIIRDREHLHAHLRDTPHKEEQEEAERGWEGERVVWWVDR